MCFLNSPVWNILHILEENHVNISNFILLLKNLWMLFFLSSFPYIYKFTFFSTSSSSTHGKCYFPFKSLLTPMTVYLLYERLFDLLAFLSSTVIWFLLMYAIFIYLKKKKKKEIWIFGLLYSFIFNQTKKCFL